MKKEKKKEKDVAAILALKEQLSESIKRANEQLKRINKRMRRDRSMISEILQSMEQADK